MLVIYAFVFTYRISPLVLCAAKSGSCPEPRTAETHPVQQELPRLPGKPALQRPQPDRPGEKEEPPGLCSGKLLCFSTFGTSLWKSAIQRSSEGQRGDCADMLVQSGGGTESRCGEGWP